MDVCTLASGSKGNCLLASCGQTHILIDAGVSARRITRSLGELGLRPEELSAVFITHGHSDHVSGLRVLSKKLRCPIWATHGTALDVGSRVPELSLSILDRPRQVGGLHIDFFPTSHDAPGSVGYRVAGDGMRFVLCTDLGCLSQPVLDAAWGIDLLIAEANHDVEWVRSGPYPYYLQERILGKYGHLSNEAGAELAELAARGGAQAVVLAHLSQENNTPARARETVARTLEGAGFPVHLSVAPVQERGPVFRLEHGRVAVLEEILLC
jgi:phosphoribosyl 1,2-cyclic phosphodiesterase